MVSTLNFYLLEAQRTMDNAWLLLCIFSVMAASAHSFPEVRKLKVGEELVREQLALEMGSCIYELEGLELSKWYEVKISYPASIPAAFTFEILKDAPRIITGGRRLLNTEKLIFKADDSQLTQVLGELSSLQVLVTVQSAGVVAKRHVKEQPIILYNILCEELQYGIPVQALWIGFLGLAVTILSFIIPAFLPPQLRPRKPLKRSPSQVS